MNKKNNENQPQLTANDKIARHRPAGASVMNARDPMSKQKMSSICEPGPLKRAQGKNSYKWIIISFVHFSHRFICIRV